MSQPVRATLEDARVAPIPPGFRSSRLMQHGSMTLRYYKPAGPDLQTPHDQDELYVVVVGGARSSSGGSASPSGPATCSSWPPRSSIGSRNSRKTSRRGSFSTVRRAASAASLGPQ